MKLVFGLGNPGKEYDGSRHNVGFAIVGAFAKQQGSDFRSQSKFKADTAEFSLDGEKIILAKPATFYNLSGESYRLICDYYKISPDDTLVIHDELALPFGTLRTRVGGSDAGNNGVKSVLQHGGQEAHRLRIGVANELQGRIGDVDFVLGKFNKDEVALFSAEIMPKALSIIEDFVTDHHEITTHVVPTSS